MPNAPKPESEFCASCGFPMRGRSCDACGATRDAAPREPAPEASSRQPRPQPVDPDVDLAGLERAVEAHRAKDLPRFVDQLLMAEGPSQRAQGQVDGPAWIVVVRGALLFVSLKPGSDELLVDVPLGRLTSARRVPAMRYALELAQSDPSAPRIALRGDVLLLRLWSKLSAQTPALLRRTLRDVAQLATRWSGIFQTGFGAIAVVSDEQRATATFDALGRPKKIHLGGSAITVTSGSGSMRRSLPPPAAPPPSPPSDPRQQAVLAPIAPPPPSTPMRDPKEGRRTGARPPIRREEEQPDWAKAEQMPAILAPAFASQSTSQLHAVSDLERKRATTAVEQRRQSVGGLSRGPQSAPEVELEAFSRKPPATTAITADLSKTPADRLCILLRQAQQLSTAVLEERPASLTWLVRSTVFRAIYDYRETLPDAVAHLYRCTGVGRDTGHQTSPIVPDPPLVVIERVLAARGLMPKERPLAIEPMTTAAQAKDHVSRYLSEIDRAPADANVRHFLAVGALTELLTRTKLPAQTDQRLRDIVTHAQREGAKNTSIDLMMTALNRITG